MARKRILRDLVIDEISSVDKPAQEGALAVIRKADDADSEIPNQVTSHTRTNSQRDPDMGKGKDTTMPTLDEMVAENNRLRAIMTLPPNHKAHYDGLDDDAKAAFMALDDDARTEAASVAKRATFEQIIHDAAMNVAKQRVSVAATKDELDRAYYEEYSKLMKEPVGQALYAKSLDYEPAPKPVTPYSAPSDIRAEQQRVLKAQESGGDRVLDALAKQVAEDEGITYEQAYVKALDSEIGRRAYAAHVG